MHGSPKHFDYGNTFFKKKNPHFDIIQISMILPKNAITL